MNGGTTGGVRWSLRIESLCVLGAAVLINARQEFGWGIFALFFLAPDLSMLGYLAGPRIGAIAYNAAHSYIGPMACLVFGFLMPAPAFLCASLIWSAHIGVDRFLGYGLKYSSGFGQTHLGMIGRFGKSTPNQVIQPDA